MSTHRLSPTGAPRRTIARGLTLAMVAVVTSLVVGKVGYWLGNTYIDRLPDHRGLYLVAVDDAVAVAPLSKPRRAVFIVVDGLRQDAARTMRSMKKLQRHGQCNATDAGNLTISRPMYAVISSGVEADRTGARNNDETSPVAVQSVFETARAAGLRVHGASDVPWWQELFPKGFDNYLLERSRGANLFDRVELADLTLIHPGYVDGTAHDLGARSAAYREAVARVDAQIEGLLGRLDLSRDLVVITADHGHSLSGGHGGTSAEIATVLTCWAGPGVRHARGRAIDSRTIAPTLSVLLGLPFPRHMRAVDDDLDSIWGIVSRAELGDVYLTERRGAVERFRVANRAALGAWMGTGSGTWEQLYRQGRRHHALLWLVVALFLALGITASMKLRGMRWRSVLGRLAWMAAVVLGCCGVYIVVRGSFDFTSINKRQPFIHASLATCLSVGILGAGLHVMVWRRLEQLVADQLTLMLAVLVVHLAHPLIYGAPLGFPLPGPVAIFLPFFASALVLGLAGATLAGSVLLAGRYLLRRSR